MQLVTYGTQDLYLTGTPQITFFKIVYRRHTNFSIESIKVKFDDQVGFGKTSMLTVPKIGDLIHKTYLEILLPSILLNREPNQEEIDFAQQIYDNNKSNYEIVTKFLFVNRKAYADAYDIYIAENSTTLQMQNAINDVFNNPIYSTIISDFNNLVDKPYDYNSVSMQSISNLFLPTDNKVDLYDALNIGIKFSINTQNYYYNKLIESKGVLEDVSSDIIKFAWVERIGHAIIEEINVNIGGQIIDRHYGEWINIWYELTANRDMEIKYFKMIGNVSILTDFNRIPKPCYLLRVPLQFWFNRYTGLSLPLVALEYHDVVFQVKFRKLEQVSYVEDNTFIKLPCDETDNFRLNEISEIGNINITANMLIDYIFLDSSERRRFAQSSHEYLIDQLQVCEMTNITLNTLRVVLNNFVHPMIELVWIAQRNSYVTNLNGFNKSEWFNYTTENNGNIVNTVAYSTLDFHGYTRSMRLNSNYYNYVQPYKTHNTSPNEGINIYSFALFPEEFQPSGSANMSRLSRVSLFLEFDSSLFSSDLIVIDNLNVRVYGRNLNILRFVSGMAGTAFTY